jgi:DNA polymerase-3 subunit epsilon
MFEESAARIVEAAGGHRVLRRFRPPAEYARPSVFSPVRPRVAAAVSARAVGRDPSRDPPIELGAVLFTYDPRTARIFSVSAERHWYNDPGVAIPERVAAVTGIGPDTVAGRAIPAAEAAAFLARADLVVAHGAGFVRPLVERALPELPARPWACAAKEVDWAGQRLPSRVDYLLEELGLFPASDTAPHACRALVHILAQPLVRARRTGFALLLDAARAKTVRVYATDAPYGAKDALKGAAWHWNDGADGRPKAWWKEAKAGEEAAVLAELAGLVPGLAPTLETVGATERWRGAVSGR